MLKINRLNFTQTKQTTFPTIKQSEHKKGFTYGVELGAENKGGFA